MEFSDVIERMALLGKPTLLVTLVMETAVEVIGQMAERGYLPAEVDRLQLADEIRRAGLLERAVQGTFDYAEEHNIALLSPSKMWQ